MTNLPTPQTDSSLFITELYQAVDSKDCDFLQQIFADDINFRIGNFDTLTDIDSALASNSAFFNSIQSMLHSIDNVWSINDNIICNGTVDYVRLDGSDHSCYFSTALTFSQGKISEFYVYADLSGL